MKKRVNYALPVLIITVVLFVLIYMAVTRKTDVVQDKNDVEYDVIMSLDFDRNYPQSPDKVLEAYNVINKFLSGNTNRDFTDDDLTVLLDKQRQLMDTELLALNPIENHISEYKEKMAYLEEEGTRLIQVNVETPVFSEDARRCSIAATQFWSKSINISLIYNLRREKDSDKWKIVGWELNQQQME